MRQMHIGYPRFFVHRSILRLAGICGALATEEGKEPNPMILFPTAAAAAHCVEYLRRHSAQIQEVDPNEFFCAAFHVDDSAIDQAFQLEIHGASFPPPFAKLAKSFWQHAGLGVSSRYADRVLSLIEADGRELRVGSGDNPILRSNLASEEKLKIRQRLCALYPIESPEEDKTIASWNGDRVAVDDMYLYPTGMSAIFHIHQVCMSMFPARKSVSFGFSYTDTFKVLEKWGPGAHLFFEHPDQNLRDLEALLSTLANSEAGEPSLAAIFCELPSNPLLLSPDLPRLHALAVQHNVPLILDNTVGDPVTVDALEYADVVVTSLSKMFSGRANVMGGSLLLNKDSPHFTGFKRLLENSYVDDYYHEDAIVMEENSRDFSERVHVANANATAICEFVRSQCAPPRGSAPPDKGVTVIKDIFFPKFVARENFDLVRRRTPRGKTEDAANNYGTLFTLSFTSLASATAFFDALPCAKGPSLGTNFTLSCPYTLLGHYNEREWVAGYGVLEEMVRVSVGLEDMSTLEGWFSEALRAAQEVA